MNETSTFKEEVYRLNDEIAYKLFNRCIKLRDLSRSMTETVPKHVENGVLFSHQDESGAFYVLSAIARGRIHNEELKSRCGKPGEYGITVIRNKKIKGPLSKIRESKAKKNNKPVHIESIEDTTDHFIEELNSSIAAELAADTIEEILKSAERTALKAKTEEDFSDINIMLSFANEVEHHFCRDHKSLIERKENISLYIITNGWIDFFRHREGGQL